MMIDNYIHYWAKLIRESSDDLTQSELLDEKSPEVNNKLEQRKANFYRTDDSSMPQQSKHSKPNNKNKRIIGKIIAHPITEVNRVIQNYINGDIKFDFSSINKVFQKFQKIFGMSYWSSSRYLKIKNRDELVVVRIANHRAVGEHFHQANKDCSRFLSIFIGEDSNHIQSPVAYTEIRYKPQVFDANPKAVVDSMFYSLQKFLHKQEISIDKSLGTKTDYIN